MAVKTLTHPPFPPLTWVHIGWSGTIELSAWKKFQSCQGSYGSRSSKKIDPGKVTISVSPVDKKKPNQITQDQTAAYKDLLDREPTLSGRVIRSVYQYISKIRKSYIDEFGDTEDEFDVVSKITSLSRMREYVGLSTIHVLPFAKKGVAYIGFEIGTEWDEEHGTGVLTHRGRVIKIGGAEVSYCEPTSE